MKLDQLVNLLAEAGASGGEMEWLECKENDENPQAIGEYISAISNVSALLHRERGFLVWGISDSNKEPVGTSFRPRTKRVGNEELQNWLAVGLEPRLDFQFHEFDRDGKHFVVLEIPAAFGQPTRFKNVEFIRVGTYKKRLSDHPEKERTLWSIFSNLEWEYLPASEPEKPVMIFLLIDVPRYFAELSHSRPTTETSILEQLVAGKMIRRDDGGRFSVTNLGAVLFARDLRKFQKLARKAPRVVSYPGRERGDETIEQQIGQQGYAIGFKGLVSYISARLPKNEQIKQAIRTELPLYPDIAIREIAANMLLHQDFTIMGSGPIVEIFSDRIEFTNPGAPLVEPDRFLDAPAQARNDALASIARLLGICEERGSGIDKVVNAIEIFQLPPADFIVSERHTKAVLFAPRPLADMAATERIRACYQHASLKVITGDKMSNATLRKRFGILDKNYTIASKIISDTIAAGLIRRDPSGASKRNARYLPYWG